ncbi:MAG: SUMF1/EgtB/PvdO family nonheme iron enzyme [Anaerolineae bacterium]|mgnify:CR=1 FL=1
MVGLSPALYTRCRETLLRCHEFTTDDRLRTVFAVDTLAPFRHALPGAPSPAARVAATLDYLLDKSTAAGRPALPLFLTALRDRCDPGDALYADLEALARDVAAALAAPGASLPPVDPTALKAYLEVVSAQCCQMETRPYRQLSELRGAPPSLTLLGDETCPAAYVPLRFDVHRTGRTQETGRAPGWRQTARQRELAPEEPAFEPPDRDAPEVDVDLARVLSIPGHVVFLGQAGSGKTTVLRLIAAVLATQDPAALRAELGLESSPPPGSPLSPAASPSLPIPIFVALREFEYACQQSHTPPYTRDVASLLRFMDDQFAKRNPGRVPPGFVSGLVRGGGAWVLLDALDEVADFDHRIAVRQTIEDLADAFPNNRFLVTARVAAYEHVNTRLDARFNLATVRDLTRAQWALMVERLYAGLERNAALAAERAAELLARIDASETLQAMVKTPLMVWTATHIHYTNRKLPEQRAELYRAYVDILLGARLQEEEGAEAAQELRDARWPADDRRYYLIHAAFKVHEGAAQERVAAPRQDAPVIVDETTLVKQILPPIMAPMLMLDLSTLRGRLQVESEARDFVKLMTERSGLLPAHPEGYTFGHHLTLQEFLAALYLVEHLHGQERRAFLAEHVGQSWWREVILLMAGSLLRQPQQAQQFLLQELGNLPGDGDTPAYGLAWAGRALLEIPPARVGWHAGARDTLAKRLVQVLWRTPPTTSVTARIEVGEVLGRLGDPRFSGELCLPEFIPLPGGEFWMGTDEAEAARLEQYFAYETPRHKVYVDAFALAQVPTTNAMFARFIEAGGYRDPRWWVDAPKGFWRPEGTIKGWWGDERSQPAFWDDAHFNAPNQPVVGVTWYEAVAYCRWLTAMRNDGHIYRLPTEAEWERAARGLIPPSIPPGGGEETSPPLGGIEGGRIYAWGNTWQPNRANTKELNLERTTPVGIFPDGATPEGLLDMTGNVWEWCNDWYDKAAYGKCARQIARNPAGPERGQYKILRGGSFYNEKAYARCAFRHWLNPARRIVNGGFRVARGSL